MKSISDFLPVFLPVVLFFSLPVVATGGPSHRDIDAEMDIHNLTEMKLLLTASQKLYEDCFSSVGKLSDLAAKGGAGRLPPNEISSTRVGLELLDRHAIELQLHGETAGYDYMLRISPLQTRFGVAVELFNASPNGQAAAQRARLSLQKTKPARDAALKTAQQFAQQKMWPEAFDVINRLFDDTILLAVFLPLIEQQRIYDEFVSLRLEIISNRNSLARTAAIAKLELARETRIPDTKALLGKLTSAADGLRSSAIVQVDEQQLTGPQTLAYFLEEWRKIQVMALRHRGILWAQRVKIGRTGGAQPPPEDNSFEHSYRDFCGPMAKGLIGLMEAEAARASAEETPALYLAHINVLAQFLPRIADPELADVATGVLDPWVAKAPNFAADVQAYHAATDEYLRWRERAYGAISAAYQGQSPPLEGMIVEQGKSSEGFSGMFEVKDPLAAEARMIGSAPEILAVLSPRILEKPVWIRDLVGLPNKKLGVARLFERTYATAAWLNVAEQIGTLKSDLLVTAQLPPLTLAGAVAIQSAENGDFSHVGGLIKGVYLEGLVSRFAALPESGASLVALGPLPRELPSDKLLSHLITRCELTPTWVHHRYFFADLTVPTEPANAAAETPAGK